MNRNFLAVVLGLAGFSSQGCSATADPVGEPGAPAETEHVGASAEALTTTLYSCTNITKPGSYQLGKTLVAASGQPCIQVHSQGVTLDCRSYGLQTASPALVPLLIEKSQNFTIQNCFIGAIGEYNGPIVRIENSSNGTLTNNHFTRSPVATETDTLSVVSSSGITFKNSSSAAPLQLAFVTSSTIENNSFSCWSTSCTGMIQSYSGFENYIAYNTIDGRSTVGQTTQGTDDGIIIHDEAFSGIVGNTISNVYDCGIEFLGNIESSTVNNNTITNADLCGIGGWYWLSFSDNTVHGNTVSGATNLFTFMHFHGLRPYNWDGNGAAADTGVYFSDNTFDGNSITNPYPHSYWGPSDGVSVYIPFETSGPEYLLFNGSVSQGETVPTASQFFLTGNWFSNNNFGSEPAFFGEPMYSGAVSDQGGNVCVKQSFADFPLACGR